MLIGWSREKKEDIANLRQVHLEAIREKYRLHQEGRIELFGKQLEAVESELAKRPLDTVPTERLFDIMVKLTRELAQDVAAPTFQRRENPLQTDILDCHMAGVARYSCYFDRFLTGVRGDSISTSHIQKSPSIMQGLFV